MASLPGDGLVALGASALAHIPGQHHASGLLDLSGGDRRAFVAEHQPEGLLSDVIEDVVKEGIHHPSGLLGQPEAVADLLADLTN